MSPAAKAWASRILDHKPLKVAKQLVFDQ